MNMLCPNCWGLKTNGLPPMSNPLPCVVCSGVGATADQQLSPHFRLSEMIRSATALRMGLPNNPTTQNIANLTQLCLGPLESLRTQFGALYIDSGLRVAAVNEAVKGSGTSAHPAGWAADINVMDPDVTRKSIVDWIVASDMEYDQVIFEGTWVHIALFDSTGTHQRKQALSMFPDPHFAKLQYFPYDAADPRIST